MNNDRGGSKPGSNGQEGGLLDAALDYAARGWHVLPLHWIDDGGKCSCRNPDCKSEGKHPLTPHGLKDASTDPAQIREWWERWPRANVGVRTGAESGVWMLGPDGQAGIDALAELVKGLGVPLPRTPSARSGSGGRHYYFRWPAGGGIPSVRNHRGLPIDLRGEGGYFVAPPSANKNGPYVCEIHPHDCPLAEAPDGLLDWARTRAGRGFKGKATDGASIVDRAIAYLAKMPAAVAGQGGHDRTMDAARVVVWGFDLGPEVGFSLLWQHYNPRCRPPWSEKELRHKCEDANAGGAFGLPRGWLLDAGGRTRQSKGAAGRARAAATPPGDDGGDAPRLRTTCAADVQPKPLRWLVPDLIPRGKLVLLAGDGGLGKSIITLDLAARLSRGQCAFGLRYEATAGETLIASCEDDRADTIVPRLLAVGADRNRVHLLDGVQAEGEGRPAPWSLAHHSALERFLEGHPVDLVIIDPASAYAGLAGIDGHKDAELRALLGPLTDVAARHDVTILLVAHLGKNEGVRAVRRVLGSVAWVNAVRAAWVVAEREEDEGKRLLLPVKANLAPRRRGLVYQLIPLSGPEQELALAGCPGLTPDDRDRLKHQLFRVAWLGETDADPDKVFAAASRRPEPPSDIKRAADWLRQFLAGGPVESGKCVAEGNAALQLNKPLKWWRDSVLKGELEGKPRKDGQKGPWLWGLRDSSDSSDSSQKTRGKAGFAAGRAAGGSPQKTREKTEESEESQESHTGNGYVAPDADPDAMYTPFE